MEVSQKTPSNIEGGWGYFYFYIEVSKKEGYIDQGPYSYNLGGGVPFSNLRFFPKVSGSSYFLTSSSHLTSSPY